MTANWLVFDMNPDGENRIATDLPRVRRTAAKCRSLQWKDLIATGLRWAAAAVRRNVQPREYRGHLPSPRLRRMCTQRRHSRGVGASSRHGATIPYIQRVDPMALWVYNNKCPSDILWTISTRWFDGSGNGGEKRLCAGTSATYITDGTIVDWDMVSTAS